MSSSKIVDPGSVVSDACRATARASAGLRWVERPGYFTRRVPADDARAGRVAVVSGGGSGHEPMHSGFVGAGMLDAAVPGAVFTSPNSLAVAAATRAVDGGAGVVHVVKNYTGDVINFGVAADLCRADGIDVETVLVDDDVATDSSDPDGPGRRGTAATVVVEKLCGAAAARGDDLAAVAALGRRVAAAARSMAVAFRACTVPGASAPSFDLGDDEVELGVGIHGERGTGRTGTLSAREVVEALLGPVLDALDAGEGDDVILVVNGLGGTHALEIAVVFGDALELLAARGIRVRRHLVGTFVTAFDMAGVSLTVVRCGDELPIDDVLALWDAPTAAPAWPGRPAGEPAEDAVVDGESDADGGREDDAAEADATVTAWVARFTERVRGAVDELTDLDRRAGDGDFGVTMDAGLRDAPDPSTPLSPAATFSRLSRSFLENAGGTSGALFGAIFHRMADATAGRDLTAEVLADAVRGALEIVVQLGGASAGDRTMVDALAPAADALDGARGESVAAALAAAADAAARGAEATATMTARRGRASYVGDAARDVVDPGALAVAWFFAAGAEAAAG
ncbi:dihydroxyacetone kinase family protein [Rhodococcoides corynebacterioides]|uniref:Dihydroxyacetone kinase subunit DhaK n=1 Tax=Rhodococcoides corynebacterioides TaxID=53972 RepID=A0ABS7P214_9NOCA|nr:dihydroxyacetone kinase family protein [Rhodococcus corynebacterioides]MBY6366422.1 dihydroxyacetone kinase subunit DhaK [Rhodococcus corynebacterioides]MBY6407022.1 dihydroxyacetone kinase subunit DhaK [Rhodococcus corynebacterioides]